MVLYTLKGITRNEFDEIFSEILESGEDIFTYIVTKKDEKYRLHTKNGWERKCFGVLNPIEMEGKLLCEMTFDETEWWRQRSTITSILAVFDIIGFIVSFVLVAGAFDSPSSASQAALILPILSFTLLIIIVHLNSIAGNRSADNRNKLQQAFEGWFKEYL